MSGVDFDRVMQLLVELRSLETDARAARLDDIGADEPALRAEVESILAHGDTGDFLETPAIHTPAVLADAMSGAGEPPLPDVIGRYRIIGRLGVGGMGMVYHAEQDQPRREVALKLIRSRVMSRNILLRFRQEAELLGRLQHPGIAQIYDAGTFDDGEGGQPYFAMELVRGNPLTEHAKQADLDTRSRLELFARVCDAVEHAHRKGVIHRDLKPDNILIQADGAPKILDFGVARATDSDIQVTTVHTDVGQVIGTVPYMSPEQIAGDIRDIDTRTDVYALGVVLYELLSGRLPHDLAHRSIPEAARIICDEEHTRLSSVSTTFRGDIDTIVAKALAKERDRRYPSAAVLAADVRRHLGDQPIVARPTSTFYQLRKFVRRNRGLSSGVAAAVLVLIGGIVVSTSLYVKAEKDRRAADWQSYLGNVTVAPASVTNHNYTDARLRLDLAPEEHRGWEWRHWSLAQDLSIDRVEHNAPVTAIAISRDGRRVVTVTADDHTRVWDFDPAGVDAGDPLPTWELVDELTPPSSAPSGNIAVTADGAAVILGGRSRWKPGSGETPAPVKPPDPAPDVTTADLADADRGTRVYDIPVAASADGRRIVSAGSDGTARVWDVERKTTEHVLSADAAVRSVAYAPDGAVIATGDENGRIVVWDAAEGEPRFELEGHEGRVTALAFHPDGDRLVSGSLDNTIRVWDARAGRLLSTMGGHEASVTAVAVHPGGRWILSAGIDTALRVWDIDTGSASIAIPHPAPIGEVTFSPDGTRLVVWDGRQTYVRDAATGDPQVTIPTPYTTAMAVRGETALTAGRTTHRESSKIDVWSLENGENLLPRIDFRASALFVHPDGAIIASSHGAHSALIEKAGEIRMLAWTGGGYAVAISADGRFAISGGAQHGDSELVICDIESLTIENLKGHHGGIRDFALHPDGRRVVSASADRTLRVWDLPTRRCVDVLRGHEHRVESVDVSPDGRRIVSGSEDRTVRVWDFETGDLLATLDGHDGWVESVDFSPDGRRIASGDAAGVVRIWETELDSARRMWQAAAVRHVLDAHVETHFERLGGIDAVEAALRQDASLDAPSRDLAVRLARTRLRPEPARAPFDMRGYAWEIARKRRGDRADYEEAHRFIEDKAADEPAGRTHWNTLGALRYRLRQYDEALEAFDEAERLNAAVEGGFHVAHYRVWQAPCHYYLGDTQRARALLAEARAAPPSVLAQVESLIQEAAAVIEAGDPVRP